MLTLKGFHPMCI